MAAIEIVRRDLDAAGLRRAAGRSRDAAAARRRLALALVLEGKSRKEAAEACGMDRQALRDWVIRCNAEGLAGLSDRKGAVGPKRRLSPEQEAEVAEWVRRGPDLAEHGVVRWRRADLARAIKARFGAGLAEREPWEACYGGSASGGWWRVLAILATTLRRRRLSGKLCRPRGRAAAGARSRKADRALVAGPGAHWPAGHAHPRLGRARLASGRAPRPAPFLGLPVRRDLPRARHGRGTGAALVLPAANVGTMNLHLAEIAKAASPGAHALLVLDGAGWHQPGGRLKVPQNITLLHLPPCSPEPNPVENVWAYLRSNKLSNRVFDTYEAIVDAWLATPGPGSSLSPTASPLSAHEHGLRSINDAGRISRPLWDRRR